MPIAAGTRQRYWNPQTVALCEVRLRARDLAGNWGEASTTVGVNGNNPGAAPVPPESTKAVHAIPACRNDVERKFVNSTKITLNYELKEVGPSGVSQIELWYTLDGRTWSKYDELKFGSDPNQKSVTFEVAGEGVYGISLIARSGVGLGEKPPQTGDRPQVWIEVDATKPIVQLHNVVVGQGVDKGKADHALEAPRQEPGTRADHAFPTPSRSPGRGRRIAERLPNTGRYVWAIPEKIPYQFFMKVEAIDRARNVGEAVTPELIRVDLSIPRVIPGKVEPAN